MHRGIFRQAAGIAIPMALGFALVIGLVIWIVTGTSSADVSQKAVEATLVSPPNVPEPLVRKATKVQARIEAVEKRATLANGVEFEFWGYNGTVPGPMMRVKEGDTIEFHYKNSAANQFPHSIDLHAVTGPGGGATLTQVTPGQEASFSWKALKPGLYVYHCATPLVPHHIANGMYGMILVEPKKGLPKVDREFYVMQGEIYTQGAFGQEGFQPFSLEKMLREEPEYVVFNGAVGALTGENALKAKVGEKVRIYFGVGGPNLTSSFHVIGEIFDKVYPEASLSTPLKNVQTTLVPTGGATVVEMKLDVPGRYILVDHSLTRLAKGAAAELIVEGPEAPDIYKAIKSGSAAGGH